MNKNKWIILGLAGCVAIAALAYFWATGIMDSLYAFRSPLASQSVPIGAPIETRISRRVVAILVDGLRVDTAADASTMPFLNTLRAQAASATIHSSTPSYSAPSWSVLMIGAWPEVSDGPAMNPDVGDTVAPWSQDNAISAIHRAGLKTAFAGSYFFPALIPAQALDASFLVYQETDADDQQTADAAVEFIESGAYDFLLIHIAQVDHAGHIEGGPRDPRWNAAAQRADQRLAKIVGALDLNQDTVLIFSDHGQIDAGGHGGQDAIVLVQPFVMAGAGVRPGVYADIHQVDIAPTLSALLGANLPAIAQGRVLSEMLVFDDAQTAALFAAALAQQQALYEAYANALGVEARLVSVAPGQDPVTVYQAALADLQAARLAGERLPRFLVAGLLALAPAFFLFKVRSRAVGWYLAGGLIYLAVFHLQYALLRGRTYSLSSVASSADIIGVTAISAAIAFAAAWLATMAGRRAFVQTPFDAVQRYLGFLYVTLYLAALPAFWHFAYNGALIAWILPDMTSTFLGFLTILQVMVLAALGALFTGVTALAALVVRKP